MAIKTKAKRTVAVGSVAVGSRKKPSPLTPPSRVKRLSDSWPPLTAVVPITSFAPEPFVVSRPMSVVIQPLDGEHLATFFDANLNASGETQEEAFANLKDVMLATFQMLERMTDSQLGPGPRRQRAVLLECLQRVD